MKPAKYVEIAQKLRNHPNYDPDGEDISAESVRVFVKDLKAQSILEGEILKAFGAYLSRPDMWNPFGYIREYGFDLQGKCIIRRGKPQKREWHMAEPYSVGPVRMRAYCAQHSVSLVNQNLEYVMINGRLVDSRHDGWEELL